METLSIISNLLVENLDIDQALINEQATFESLGVDSLDMVDLICELEEQCEIEFGEPDGLETVGDLVNYIESLKN
jgi:acyl carrier protein